MVEFPEALDSYKNVTEVTLLLQDTHYHIINFQRQPWERKKRVQWTHSVMRRVATYFRGSEKASLRNRIQASSHRLKNWSLCKLSNRGHWRPLLRLLSISEFLTSPWHELGRNYYVKVSSSIFIPLWKICFIIGGGDGGGSLRYVMGKAKICCRSPKGQVE